jgi:hypothetical protein
MRESISSNQFSTDLQAMDALSYLEHDHPDAYAKVRTEFPELDRALSTLSGMSSWVDTEELDLDPEYMSWVVYAIEETGVVYWEDGEPWIGRDDENEEETE